MEAREESLTTADLAAPRGSATAETTRPAEEERGERAGEVAAEREGKAREPDASGSGAAGTSPGETTFLPADELGTFRSRWEVIQGGFVDQPRRSVEEADALVAELMRRIAETLSEERAELESQWDRGDDVSTEDLRVTLQRYRSFFDRLLST